MIDRKLRVYNVITGTDKFYVMSWVSCVLSLRSGWVKCSRKCGGKLNENVFFM